MCIHISRLPTRMHLGCRAADQTGGKGHSFSVFGRRQTPPLDIEVLPLPAARHPALKWSSRPFQGQPRSGIAKVAPLSFVIALSGYSSHNGTQERDQRAPTYPSETDTPEVRATSLNSAYSATLDRSGLSRVVDEY